MKITDVKTTTLSGYKDWNFVRVETDEGISGLGEAHPGEGMTDVVQKRLKPLILGKDPRNVEPLYNHMITRTVGQSVAGMVVGAIGGVELLCGISRENPWVSLYISFSVVSIEIQSDYTPTSAAEWSMSNSTR